MSGHDARVRNLVSEGQITQEEGERLQRALQGGDSGVWAIVRNPIEYLRPGYALAAAVVIIVASLGVSQLGVRFDGALDVHRVNGTPPWSVAIVDQLIAVPLTALVLWVASLLVVRQGRPQDFVIAVALARLPTLLMAVWSVVVLPPPDEIIRQAMSGQVTLRLMLGALSSLPFTAWKFVWLYRGFAESAGICGAKAVVTFLFAIISAEVLSKLVLAVLY